MPIPNLFKFLNSFSKKNLEDLTSSKTNPTQKEFNELQLRATKLSAEKDRLAIIIEGVYDGILALDINKRIILFNKTAQNITGLSAQEVLGKQFDEVIHLSADLAQIKASDLCPTVTSLEDKIIFNKQETKLTNKFGKSLTVNITSTMLSQAHTTNLGCIITIHDVSREHELESMKLDFVSMAAHELRTPITSIKGYLDVFINENSSKVDKDANMLLSQIKVATGRLLALVENLLNVSRIERGIITMNMENVNWIEVVKSTVNDLKPRAQEKNIQLEMTPTATDILNIEADRLRIGEVLSNLISNAINYTDPGGCIQVSIEANSQEITTHVADTGQGIPKEAIPHLFNKFFRVSGSLTQKSKGTGLGLYISKSIIDMHHGKIWVTSEVGKGSTFSFLLPIRQTA